MPYLPRDFPASLRFLRQRPLLVRARGSLPPPGLGTCGIFLPALRSATVGLLTVRGWDLPISLQHGEDRRNARISQLCSLLRSELLAKRIKPWLPDTPTWTSSDQGFVLRQRYRCRMTGL